MLFGSRKFYIWLTTMAVVLCVYIIYNLAFQTPEIVIETPSSFPATDDNIPTFDSERGKIGEIEIGSVQKARYTQLDKNKKISREFGFEKLLYEAGDEWFLEKPYMIVYQSDFSFDITADNGHVQVETAAGRPSPKDAILTGNVVIHIKPVRSGQIQEGFVYLDNVAYVSERSQFSTNGPVKFVSAQAEMTGKGMEIIYDNRLKRMELFKIERLDRLLIKAAKQTTDSAQTPEIASSQTQAAPKTDSKPARSIQKPENYYQCTLSGNVKIEYGQQLVLADEISINNIVFEKSRDKKQVTKTESVGKSDLNSKPSKQHTLMDPKADVIVNCDNGLVLKPMEPVVSGENAEKLLAQTTTDFKTRDLKSRTRAADNSKENILSAEKIDYDMITGNTVASGWVGVKFYAKIKSKTDSTVKPVPVKITAKNNAMFLPESQKIIFNGNVAGNMFDEQQEYTQHSRFYGDTLIIDIASQQQDQPGLKPSTDIDHISLLGAGVKLISTRLRGSKLLSGIELKCRKLDYDTSQEIIVATGPGEIKIDNSKAIPTEKDDSRFGLKGPYYAYIDGFDTLRWLIKQTEVIVDGGPKSVHIGYLPILSNGRYGKKVLIDTSHTEADYTRTQLGQTKLVSLLATDGISYQEADIYQFVGNKLYYNDAQSLLTVSGRPDQPCFLNGAVVDGIKYNLITGRAKAELVSPGSIQLP